MDILATVATITGSAVAVTTLVNGVWEYRRKTHLEIFRTYTDRYNAIVTPDIYSKWQKALNDNREHWAELTPSMVKYLNLVWEEFYLSRAGVIPRRLWRLWLPEIRQVLASDFAKSTMTNSNFHFPPELTCRS
jgi:hypothetical protein